MSHRQIGISKLVFYAQSTSAVISGRRQIGTYYSGTSYVSQADRKHFVRNII